jgi:hypothetical protein
MRYKLTSKDLMDKLDESNKRIDTLASNINIMKTEIERRMLVFQNQFEFNAQQLHELNHTEQEQNNYTSVFLKQATIAAGDFESYGLSVYPSLVKTPVNIFNFSSITGSIFKNNAQVTINDKHDSLFNNILVEDSIQNKETVFAEFDNPNIKLTVTIDPNELLGSPAFNTIDILPYLPGSYTINQIDIYTMQDYQAQRLDEPTKSIKKDIINSGTSKIILDESYYIYKVTFDITINFQNANGKYPFGLHHLYFLRSSYSTNSYIIAKIEKENFITRIDEDIIVYDQYGKHTSNCTNENIEFYMNYVEGELSYQIDTSKGLTQYTIPKNINSIYAKIPIKRSMTMIKFNIHS